MPRSRFIQPWPASVRLQRSRGRHIRSGNANSWLARSHEGRLSKPLQGNLAAPWKKSVPAFDRAAQRNAERSSLRDGTKRPYREVPDAGRRFSSRRRVLAGRSADSRGDGNGQGVGERCKDLLTADVLNAPSNIDARNVWRPARPSRIVPRRRSRPRLSFERTRCTDFSPSGEPGRGG